MTGLTKRTLRMAAANAQAGLDAVFTIAARTPSLLTQGYDPTGAKGRESHRMVQEKLAAAASGAFAAQAAWGHFMIKAAFGGMRTPDDVSHGMADILEAAAGPARRTVRANARRLAGGV